MRKVLLLIVAVIVTIIASCTAPQYEKKCIRVPGKGCVDINAGNVGGTTLGNQNEDPVEENRP